MPRSGRWFVDSSPHWFWRRSVGQVRRLSLDLSQSGLYARFTAKRHLSRSIPAVREPTSGWQRSFSLRPRSTACLAERNIRAAPDKGRSVRRAHRWRVPSPDVPWPAQQIAFACLLRGAAALPRLRGSVSFRLPSNEARRCGSEFSQAFKLDSRTEVCLTQVRA